MKEPHNLRLSHNTPFNLDYTLSCGQVFRWSKLKCYWRGIVDGNVVNITQKGKCLKLLTFPDERGEFFIRRYLRLDDDLPKIIKCINKDKVIEMAINQLYGLRLVRQDPWECLISFICATYANIPRIKKMIENLSQKFGKRVCYEGGEFYTFPSEETLAKATLKELQGCGLGFRAKYIQDTARTLFKDFELESLRRLSFEDARKDLLTLTGVGPKVADCVLLFSLDKLEAFPVDVWISRIMSEHYTQQMFRSPISFKYNRINEFGRAYFEEYAGYAQEYLYHHYKPCPIR